MIIVYWHHSKMRASTALIFTLAVHLIYYSDCSDQVQSVASHQIKASVLHDIVALQRAIHFANVNYKHFNIDGILGLVLTEANLQKTVRLIDGDKIVVDLITKLILQIQHVRNKMNDHISHVQSWLNIGNDLSILRPSIWLYTKPRFPIVFQNILPFTNATEIDKILNSRKANYPISGNQTVPSDYCICLFAPKIKDIDCSKHDDVHSKSKKFICQQIIDATYPLEKLHGYPLSHYLLIRQIGNRVKHTQIVGDTYMTTNLCHRMLRDARTILSATNNKNLDLFLENVVLCSMENYFDAKFLEHDHNEIITWQRPNGCFPHSQSRSGKSDSTIKKRSVTFIGHDNDSCTDHSTGLGMAAIAAHIFVSYSTNTQSLF